MFLSEDGFGRKGFRVARMDESGKTIGSYYLTDSRLQIIVCIEDIPKLADGRTLTKMGGFIYKAGAALLDRSHTYVELGRAVGICPPIYGVDPGYKTLFNRMQITFSDLRVPAEEIERIKSEHREYDRDSDHLEVDDTEENDDTGFVREVDDWLFNLWVENNKPGGAKLLKILKDYVKTDGSPVIEHFAAGGKRGFKWRSSHGVEDDMKLKTIQNKIGAWKKLSTPSED